MARPLRIEFPGALYHITTRGDRHEAIYADDDDREAFLQRLGQVVRDFNWICDAYCLMTNHYHLVIETPDGNLSQGMRQLNGVFTQYSNRRHQQTGHLFQGRFKAILVDGDAYWLELARYVVLNPVRAGMVADPGEWPWSSHRPMIGRAPTPKWLAKDRLLAAFDRRRPTAVRHWKRFVAEGIGAESIWRHLNQQAFLGDDAFVTRSLNQAKTANDINIPKIQRRPPPPSLETIAQKHPDRDDAIVAAYATGGYSYQEIGAHFGLHFTTVGRIVRAARQ
jgi:REP element-mobilizing transposase RayT